MTLLATGIGAVTLVYSLVDRILIRPLPYPDPERLLGFQAVNRSKAVVHPAVSVADFRDFRARQQSVATLGAYRPDFATWQRPGQQPVQMTVALVTEDFFAALGVPPRMGRTFRPDEFSVSAPRGVVLSHAAWKSRFKGDPQIVGTVITLANEPTTILGVMPESFREPAYVDLWMPFAVEAPENTVRDSRYWVPIGRLAKGASIRQVQTEAETILADLAQQWPQTNRGWSFDVAPLHALRVSGVRASLWTLLAATSLLLVVACLNLANLLLARGLRRLGEMAIRVSVGASRTQLVAQILWENLLLALPGGLLGVALAQGAVSFVAGRIPPTLVPRMHEVAIDGRVLLVAIAVTVVSALLAGLLPAAQAARANVNDLLKEGGTRAGVSRSVRQLQRALVVIQVGVTFMVLTGALLLWRSLTALNRVEPGFHASGVLFLQLAPSASQYDTNLDLSRYFERLVEAAESVPGVQSVATDASPPLAGISLRFPCTLVGADVARSEGLQPVHHFVTPDFHRVLGQTLLEGRPLDEKDTERTRAVAVVNRSFARLINDTGSAVGHRIRVVPWLHPHEIEVVGVVEDARQDNLVDAPPPQVYLAQRQIPWFFSTLMVKVKEGQPPPLRGLREAVQRADGALAGEFSSLSDSIARTTAQPRLLSLLFVILGGTTLLFTLFGIFACISFSVTQRTREYGLRMALGASPLRIVREMSQELVRLVAFGLAAGLAGALALGVVLRTQLFGIGPHDPAVLTATAAALGVTCLFAALLPTVRASRISPAVAFRTA